MCNTITYIVWTECIVFGSLLIKSFKFGLDISGVYEFGADRVLSVVKHSNVESCGQLDMGIPHCLDSLYHKAVDTIKVSIRI